MASPQTAPRRRFRYEVFYSTYGTARLELRLNGAVVMDDSEPSTEYGRSRISNWVRAGRNTIEARVLPRTPHPNAVHNPPVAPELELSVDKVLPETRETIKIAQLVWPKTPTSVDLPASVQLEFTVADDVPGCQLFSEAEPFDDSAETRRAVSSFARELYGAYVRRDYAKLKALRHYQAADEERCHGRPVDPSGNGLGLDAYVQDMREQQRWRVTPLGPDDPQLELLPDRRIYRTSRGGDALVYVKLGGGMASRVEVFVARIAGQLTWVR